MRQAPIEVDPHNPAVVYHGSQYVHKTLDGGINWTKISPDLTANTPETQTDSGEPITRDMTGEEVYSALYAMRASRLEPGVLWTGSNDGPVWVTRDGGKRWKNVTPPGLPPGGRVHTIEDSPHRRGSAYVSVYRIYQNDFKPYLYLTHDYGETWTLLTDGANGIPADHPMHVVREDPRAPGLLYAGTWFGAFVSFNQGQHWQPLQQNLPVTPVTDIKVHEDDVVIATMGRSFWIMDNVTPLRQLAAGVAVSAGTSSSASAPPAAAAAGTAKKGRASNAANAMAGAQAKIAPFDASAPVFLFSPAAAYRMSYTPQAEHPFKPEFPPVGARIDYHLAETAVGDVTIEILDAKGSRVRLFTSQKPAASGAPAQGPGMGTRRGGGASTLVAKAGMNRFVWDLRHVGPWSVANPEGGAGGPLAAPGIYTVRLTAGGTTLTQPVTVKADPRVTKDGVTQADLVEQAAFSLKVRDRLSELNKLADRLKKALDAKRGDEATVRALYDALVNKPGAYPANMLISQLQNVARAVGQADQKIGASTYTRFAELVKEIDALKPRIEAAAPAVAAAAAEGAPAAAAGSRML